MALGRDAINTCRSNMEDVKKIPGALITLFDDIDKIFLIEDYKIFIEQTDKGADLNKKLTDIKKYSVDDFCKSLNSTINHINTFLDEQEKLNSI